MSRLLRTLLSTTIALLMPILLMAQPPNDNCADAIAITSSDAIDFSTLDATTDGPNHPDDCTSAGSTPDSLYNDIWFLYTPDFTGMAEFSTCNTADFDTKIAVYAPGSPCPPTDADLIACNEDGPGCDLFTSSAVFDVVSGETYLLRLGGYGDGGPGESGSGTFSVMEFIPPDGPPNDDCVNAIVLTLDANDSTFVDFTTMGANTSPPFYEETFSCFDVPNGETAVFNDVWYEWTATFSGFAEFSNCGLTGWDSRVAVYGPDESCPPNAEALVGCSDDGVDENGTNCPSFTSRAIFEVVEGSTYLLKIGGFSASNSGIGSFILKKTIPPDPPVNDSCLEPSEAFVQTQEQADEFDFIFEGFTFNASQEPLSSPSCRPSGEFFDVWYAFNTENYTDIRLRFNISTFDSDFVITLNDGCNMEVPAEEGGFCIRTDELTEEIFELDYSGFSGTPTDYLIRVATRITTDQPGEFWFQLIGLDSITTSVDELQLDHFRLFPNPAQEQLNVSFNLDESTPMTMTIQNTLGQVIESRNYSDLNFGENRFAFDIANLEAGIYFFRLQDVDSHKTVKFIKQ